METRTHFRLAGVENAIEAGKDTKIEERRLAERIWNAITKYVSLNEDGIFADPDWPHMWNKK